MLVLLSADRDGMSREDIQTTKGIVVCMHRSCLHLYLQTLASLAKHKESAGPERFETSLGKCMFTLDNNWTPYINYHSLYIKMWELLAIVDFFSVSKKWGAAAKKQNKLLSFLKCSRFYILKNLDYRLPVWHLLFILLFKRPKRM